MRVLLARYNQPRPNWAPLWADLNEPGPRGEPPPVTLAEYSRQAGISRIAAMLRIARRQVYATKLLGRWWVYAHTDKLNPSR